MTDRVEYHYLTPPSLGYFEDTVATSVATYFDKWIENNVIPGLPLGATVKVPLKYIVKFMGPGGALKEAVVFAYFRDPESAESGLVTLEKVTVNGIAISVLAEKLSEPVAKSIAVTIIESLGLPALTGPQSLFLAVGATVATSLIYDAGIKSSVGNVIDTLNWNIEWNVEFQHGDAKGGFKYSGLSIDNRTEVVYLAEQVLKNPGVWGLPAGESADGSRIIVNKSTPTFSGREISNVEGWTIVGDGFFDAEKKYLQPVYDFSRNGWAKQPDISSHDVQNVDVIEPLDFFGTSSA
jgi:hypothetical protein